MSERRAYAGFELSAEEVRRFELGQVIWDVVRDGRLGKSDDAPRARKLATDILARILESDWLKAHDAAIRAEQRETDAKIAESLYFGGGSVGSANRWGAKQAAARIREGQQP